MGGAGVPRRRRLLWGESDREHRPGELGLVPTARAGPSSASGGGTRRAGGRLRRQWAPRGMTRLTPLADGALPTSPLTRGRATRSPGGPGKSASEPASRRGMASLTPLSLDPTDRSEARPRGACPGRTREGGGAELGSDWEVSDAEKANRIEKANFLAGRLGQNQFSKPQRGMPAPETPEGFRSVAAISRSAL